MEAIFQRSPVELNWIRREEKEEEKEPLMRASSPNGYHSMPGASDGSLGHDAHRASVVASRQMNTEVSAKLSSEVFSKDLRKIIIRYVGDDPLLRRVNRTFNQVYQDVFMAAVPPILPISRIAIDDPEIAQLMQPHTKLPYSMVQVSNLGFQLENIILAIAPDIKKDIRYQNLRTRVGHIVPDIKEMVGMIATLPIPAHAWNERDILNVKAIRNLWIAITALTMLLPGLGCSINIQGDCDWLAYRIEDMTQPFLVSGFFATVALVCQMGIWRMQYHLSSAKRAKAVQNIYIDVINKAHQIVVKRAADQGLSLPKFRFETEYVTTGSGRSIRRIPAPVVPGREVWCFDEKAREWFLEVYKMHPQIASAEVQEL